MIISNSNVCMSSTRKYQSANISMKVLTGVYTGKSGKLKDQLNSDIKDKAEDEKDDNLLNFKNSLRDLTDKFNASSQKLSLSYNSKYEEDAISRVKNECINHLLRFLLGLQPEKYDVALEQSDPSVITYTYSESEYSYESEETSFETSGKVVTKDGREIDFGISLAMSRSFESYYETTSHSVQMIDPLVINLDTDIADISDQKFFFDLDADGKMDEISMLGKGSGFLALDKNNDGVINDGSELFGTISGDGFKDLAMYDKDHNGWIDEADEIFDKLKIWSFDKDGNPKLYKLSEKGVGAIYLGNVSSDFSLNNKATNEVNAAIRKTGIFLYENGAAGTVQHLDINKYSSTG